MNKKGHWSIENDIINWMQNIIFICLGLFLLFYFTGYKKVGIVCLLLSFIFAIIYYKNTR